jgi:hypothetical protein
MTTSTHAALDKRLRQLAFRVAKRRSDFAQRHRAAGVWFEIRRLLALSAVVAVIDEGEANELEHDGFAPDPHGLRLSPPKRIFSLPVERMRSLHTARPCPVRLDATLLGASSWVLQPF